jgi:hypothetical protein
MGRPSRERCPSECSLTSYRRGTDSQDHYGLARMLESSLWRAERDREALELLYELIERYPDDVRAPMSKAV